MPPPPLLDQKGRRIPLKNLTKSEDFSAAALFSKYVYQIDLTLLQPAIPVRDALHALERPLVADGGVRERGAVEAGGAGAAVAHDAARGRSSRGRRAWEGSRRWGCTLSAHARLGR